VKYNKLISKEFVRIPRTTRVLLINLAAADAEEADELAQKDHHHRYFSSPGIKFRR